MSKGLVILGSLRLEGVVISSFEVNSKAEASLFYAPSCLEVVFSEIRASDVAIFSGRELLVQPCSNTAWPPSWAA
jgi:hypothetical protein